MKLLLSVVAVFLLLTSSCLFAQVKVDKKNIPFNNYDNKYYYQGKPFTGIMRSGYNEITFQNGEVSGQVLSYDYAGKLFRKLTYLEGHFTGDFFTESYKGTFRKDTIVGLFTGFYDGGRIKSYEYDFRYINGQPGYSYKYDSKGNVTHKGIIYSLLNEYFYTAFGLIIRIESFIEGEDFSRIRSFPNLIEFSTNRMHHFSQLNPATGKPLSQQLFKSDSLIGSVSYYRNGRTEDSIRLLEPLNVFSSYENETLEKDMEESYKNCMYYSYYEKGGLKEKGTKKIIYPKEEGDAISFPETKNIHQLETRFESGIIENSWRFTESGVIDGPYLSNYPSGLPKIKATLKEGELAGPLFYYQNSGKLRFKITQNAQEEWIYEEFMPDGFLKIKKPVTENELKSASKRIIDRLRIGNRSNDAIYLPEEENLIEAFFSADTDEEQ